MTWKPTLYTPLHVQEAPRVQAPLFNLEPRTEPPCDCSMKCRRCGRDLSPVALCADTFGCAACKETFFIPTDEQRTFTGTIKRICVTCGKVVTP